MAELLMLFLCPALGGALTYHLWNSRPLRQRHGGLAVGQIPHLLRRRSRMAVRRIRGKE